MHKKGNDTFNKYDEKVEQLYNDLDHLDACITQCVNQFILYNKAKESILDNTVYKNDIENYTNTEKTQLNAYMEAYDEQLNVLTKFMDDYGDKLLYYNNHVVCNTALDIVIRTYRQFYRYTVK